MESDGGEGINSNDKIDTSIRKIYLGLNGIDHL